MAGSVGKPIELVSGCGAIVGPMDPRRAPAAAATDELRAPDGANAIAFGVLFAVSAVFLFVSYCMCRALIGGFGAGAGTIVLAVVSTFLASIFLWWFVPFADFAEIFWVHLPADRRAARAQCPHCGYPHEGRATCTECGRATEPLPAWALSLRPVKRLAWILLAAMFVGCAAGEAWCRLDEARFIDESLAARVRPFTRERAFPAAFARMTVAADGSYSSEAWPEDRRDRAWQPSDPARRERGLGWNSRRKDGDGEDGDGEDGDGETAGDAADTDPARKNAGDASP
jgi:hypothetical protein